MSDRVERTLLSAGVDGSGRDLVRAAIETAMARRSAAIDDDHHPDYLHPGRTVVVLLDDVGLIDPVALAAAGLLDTRRSDLEAPVSEVAERVSPAVADFRSAVPRPGSDALVEELLVSEPDVLLVALAERLDQVRHAQFWGNRPEARAAHREACDVYLKMAERTHAKLAARYASWCRAFGERYLAGVRDT